MASATSFLRSYLLQLRLNLLPSVPEYLDGSLCHLFILHLQTLKERLVGLCRVERSGVGERQDLQNFKWTSFGHELHKHTINSVHVLQCYWAPWAAPGLNGWLYRGWRPPHRRQPFPRSTCLTISPGHWNSNYHIQTISTKAHKFLKITISCNHAAVKWLW